MHSNGIFLFPRTFEVDSMDLLSMVVNNEEIMEIILLRCYEIEPTVMWFFVYQNNWEPVIREALKTCTEPQSR